MEAAKPYVEKAYELRDRVSERERLYITEKYYTYLTGELDKTIETLQTWARLYPDDFVPHNNLAINYKFIGRYEEALKEALEAVRLSPNNVNAHENLVGTFMSLGRFDEAEQARQAAQKINPDSLVVHGSGYLFAYRRRDQEAMDREVQWARGRPEEAPVTMMLMASAMGRGKVREAEELRKRMLELLQRHASPENAAIGLLNLAYDYMLVGRCDDAKDNAKAALNSSRGQMSLVQAAGIYSACNDQSQAQSLLEQARSAYPKNTVITQIIAPIIAAGGERNRGNYSQAIQLLESVRGYELGTILGVSTKHMRGNLYLQQRMGKEAAAEFKTILDNPGVDMFSPVNVLAHLGLARAAVLNGDTAAARKSYQDFFALWKDADQDLPVLVQARKEYEQLK